MTPPSFLRWKPLINLIPADIRYNQKILKRLLGDPDMLKRLNDIEKMAPVEKGKELFALDALIQKMNAKAGVIDHF